MATTVTSIRIHARHIQPGTVLPDPARIASLPHAPESIDREILATVGNR